MEIAIPDELILSKIYLLRDQKVMLDSDLALLYGGETKRLLEQIKRNMDRLLEDFIFQLSKEEVDNLKSQFATSSWGGRRNLPQVLMEMRVTVKLVYVKVINFVLSKI